MRKTYEGCFSLERLIFLYYIFREKKYSTATIDIDQANQESGFASSLVFFACFLQLSSRVQRRNVPSRAVTNINGALRSFAKRAKQRERERKRDGRERATQATTNSMFNDVDSRGGVEIYGGG